MKVLVTDYAWPNLDVERTILSEIGVEIIEAPDGNEETLIHLAQGVCGILTCWAQTTCRVIKAALPDLKVISRYGVGLDNIDVAFATEKRIPVTRVPDYCFIDVAEHTLAMMLALSRKVVRFDCLIRQGKWNIQYGGRLNRLTGQTLGLIGFGQIAQQVVPRAKAFGMHVVAFSPSLTAERAASVGAEAVELERLLEISDYISIHCPATEETRGMVNADLLTKMKPTTCLINTSRGEIIDETDLLKALESDTIAGVALDVRSKEPPNENDRLIAMPQVIHTPHTAFFSSESLVELQEKTAWEARRVLMGKEPINLVNPEYRK